jgi:CheY-like chemotaxis protein
MYAAALYHAGLTPIVVSTAASALSFALQADVIVTGLLLPGDMDGMALIARLKNDQHTKKIPIIALTSCAWHTERERAKSAGCDLFFAKPCLPETLLREVWRLLAESKRMAKAHLRPGKMDRGLVTTHHRFVTNTPPLRPPAATCPTCDRLLIYERSCVGGVNSQDVEQWDYYRCPTGCGTFQYRQRTRLLRRGG